MAVGTSNYPTSLDTVVELIQAANNAQTTLNGALTANATTVAVISTALFANTGCFAVDNELISYTGKTATSFTGCVRGFDGTTAATHSSGATVSDVVTTRHHEVVVDAILALQQKLGTGSSTPTAGTVLRGTGAGSSAFGAITAAEIDLTDSITNAMVNTSAAIAYSKLAALTADRLLVSSAAGAVSASTLTWNATDSAVGAIKAIDFTGVTTAVAPLRLQFNTDLVTAELGLNANVTLPIGQVEMVRVKSSTNGGLAKGKVVYVVGSDGTNKTVDYALATSATTGDTTLGIIAETVTGGNKAFCITSGFISGITTTGLTEGMPVYLSASNAGDLVASVPTPPNHRIQVGYCVKEHASQGVIFVNIRTAYELGELCDVSATAPIAAGSTLIRNATTGVWTAATLTAGTGITISNGDGSITINSTGAAAGSTGDYQINSSGAFAAGVLSQSAGRLTSTATAATSGVVPYLRIRTPTDTGLTASTEAPGIVFGGDASGSTVTRTRAAGATTLQREYIFTAPTYAADSATTITHSSTVHISGPPLAGSNATLTRQNSFSILASSAIATHYPLAIYNQSNQIVSGIISFGGFGTSFFSQLQGSSGAILRMSNSENAVLTVETWLGIDAGGRPLMKVGGPDVCWWDSTGLIIASSRQLLFGSGGSSLTRSSGIAQSASGILRLTNGTTGAGKLLIAPSTTSSGAMLHVEGEGTTTALGLLVTNSSGTARFTIRDDGAYAFAGGTVGAAQTGYTTFANLATDRTLDANNTTVEEIADVLGTLIEDLKTKGIIAS